MQADNASLAASLSQDIFWSKHAEMIFHLRKEKPTKFLAKQTKLYKGESNVMPMSKY